MLTQKSNKNRCQLRITIFWKKPCFSYRKTMILRIQRVEVGSQYRWKIDKKIQLRWEASWHRFLLDFSGFLEQVGKENGPKNDSKRQKKNNKNNNHQEGQTRKKKRKSSASGRGLSNPGEGVGGGFPSPKGRWDIGILYAKPPQPRGWWDSTIVSRQVRKESHPKQLPKTLATPTTHPRTDTMSTRWAEGSKRTVAFR